MAVQRESSIGCNQREKDSKGRWKRKHGQTGKCYIGKGWASPTYRVWSNIRKRCLNSGNKYYGGRGINTDPRWNKFENFLEDMGERLEGATIERLDNEKGYEPENCKWSLSRKEQAENRRSTVWYDINGKRVSRREAARELGVPYYCLRNRELRGWSKEQIVEFFQKSPAEQKKETSLRRKRRGILIEVDGREMYLTEFAQMAGVALNTIHTWRSKGKSLKDIIKQHKHKIKSERKQVNEQNH